MGACRYMVHAVYSICHLGSMGRLEKPLVAATAAADNADDDIEDDDIMFGADDIDGVSKANADDLSKDDVDSIMSSWL